MSPGAAVATAIGTQGYCRTTADGDARLQDWGRCSIDDELLTAAALVAAGTSAARAALVAA